MWPDQHHQGREGLEESLEWVGCKAVTDVSFYLKWVGKSLEGFGQGCDMIGFLL